MFVRPLIFVGFLLAFQPSCAAVYKWTDSNGQVHFGDRPQSEASERMTIGNDTRQSNVSVNDRHQGIVDFVER